MAVFSTRRRVVAALALPIVAGALAAVWMLFLGTEADADTFDWSPFTMVYQVEGEFASVGNRPIQVTEVHRLDYKSKTEWTDTTIEATPIDTRYGTFSNEGSYEKLSDGVYTSFHAIGDTTDTEKVDPDTRRLPNRFLIPYQMQALIASGAEPQRVATDALVCVQTDCDDHAEGLAFTFDSGVVKVFAADSEGIPLRMGDSFIVKELHITDTQQ